MRQFSRKDKSIIGIVFLCISNGYLLGFAKGKIFTGMSKATCVPGLNCYSCPGAVASCPIGALQAQLTNSTFEFPFYVVGLLMAFGVCFGRFICGFLCPFGLIQDLLGKVPFKKITVPPKVHQVLTKLKYVILVLFVIVFPLTLVNDFGIGSPTFCKWICPSGTLFGGVPLIATNEPLQHILGFLFNWKMSLLIIILISATLIKRPFCRYICPLGAIYGLFNRHSFYRMTYESTHCTHCGACEKICPMQVPVTKAINSAECIRCDRCKTVCPHKCIDSGFLK